MEFSMENRRIANHLYGVKEIARAFRVSQKTVRGWIKQGLPCVLLGNKWQGRYDELWNWLKIRKAPKPVK